MWSSLSVMCPDVVSRARPLTDSCPPGRKGLVTRAHTFGDFPHDSWGTVLTRVLLRELWVFYTSVICSRINYMFARS